MKEFLKRTYELVLGVSATLFQAWVVTLLWGWFVASIFGLPALSVVVVLGVEILYAVFMFNPYVDSFVEKERAMASYEKIVVTAVGLLAGWLIHLAM